MGIALIIKGVSFEDNNLGRITLPGDETIHSISIVGPAAVGVEGQYTISYVPQNTPQTGVVWSVVSGPATISSTGLLTTTGQGRVTIQAVSVYDSSITATKDILVGEYILGTSISWVETSATNKYVDTGITPQTSIEMDIDVNPQTTHTPIMLAFGQRNTTSGSTATDSFILWWNPDGSALQINGLYMNAQTTNQSIAAGRHNYKLKSSGLEIDGNVIAYNKTPTYVTPARTCYVGCMPHTTQHTGTTYTLGAVLYSLTIDGNTYVPAQRISDDAVGVYCATAATAFINFANLSAILNE